MVGCWTINGRRSPWRRRAPSPTRRCRASSSACTTTGRSGHEQFPGVRKLRLEGLAAGENLASKFKSSALGRLGTTSRRARFPSPPASSPFPSRIARGTSRALNAPSRRLAQPNPVPRRADWQWVVCRLSLRERAFFRGAKDDIRQTEPRRADCAPCTLHRHALHSRSVPWPFMPILEHPRDPRIRKFRPCGRRVRGQGRQRPRQAHRRADARQQRRRGRTRACRGLQALDAGSREMPGWIVTRGQIDFLGLHWQHAHGRLISTCTARPASAASSRRSPPGRASDTASPWPWPATRSPTLARS